MKNLIGNLCTYVAAGLLLSYGLVYLFRNSFMPYHSDAVSLKWEEVNEATRFLILALMRATAGGFISLSFTIIFLQYKLSTQRVSWIPVLILIIGTISMLCSAYATILVSEHTPGHPPLVVAIVGELILIVGFIFNRKYQTKP